MDLKNLKKFIKEEIKKLNKNLTEKEDHPGCDCPGSPQHGILPFYKSSDYSSFRDAYRVFSDILVSTYRKEKQYAPNKVYKGIWK